MAPQDIEVIGYLVTQRIADTKMITFPNTTMSYRNYMPLGYTLKSYTVVCLYDEKLVEDIKSNGFKCCNIGNKLITMHLSSNEMETLGLMHTIKMLHEVNNNFRDILKSVFFFISSRLNTKSGYCRLNRFYDYENDLYFTRIGPYDIAIDEEMSFNEADKATRDGKIPLDYSRTVTNFGDPSCESEYLNSFDKLKKLIL